MKQGLDSSSFAGDTPAPPRLCFVEDSFAYFAPHPPAEVWGDDWDDAPHDCNAGPPYEDKFGPIVKVAFDGPWEVMGGSAGPPFVPGQRGRNYLSADDINAGKAPWLVVWDYVKGEASASVDAGLTPAQFVQVIRAYGGEAYLAGEREGSPSQKEKEEIRESSEEVSGV